MPFPGIWGWKIRLNLKHKVMGKTLSAFFFGTEEVRLEFWGNWLSKHGCAYFHKYFFFFVQLYLMSAKIKDKNPQKCDLVWVETCLGGGFLGSRDRGGAELDLYGC